MSKINITVQLTNNDNIVKFVTKSFITQSKSYEFNNIDDAKESPIAQRLFHLPFVKTIYISQNFIAIEKFPFNLTQVKWQDVQDEVAERIVANPDTKQYGSLSVLASLFTNSKIQFNVSKNCFEPKPKILSTVITIQRETLIDEDMRMKAFEISKVAFQQKRKKIKTALKDYIDEESSKKLSLDLNLRPQELTPENYLAIAEINS